MNIPELVRSLRTARGLTQEQLARELNVTFATVNSWENGRHRPIPARVGALLSLADESGLKVRGGGPALRRQPMQRKGAER